ncbi:DUF4403 family protein [Bradyrhizobium sp. WSM 1738]|uniref:DUF4403 family protein n=1 Tax=Bradyrhizobium hereditatis TaxID=2821405 RepID=UPI001CE32C3B|nr:DUF4403 family protein [Bradyrhizobium hereditatis]MCA6119318.1 DUF4403 family protein [Bradyrhizobium hereditatis]
MILHSTTCIEKRRVAFGRSARAGLAALALIGLCSSAFAADKPPLAPDTVSPFTTDSRISATIEFSLRALASDIEEDIPRRLASIDERVSCVHRRVLFFQINANCDIYGFVERSGAVSVYGRGDRVYGSVPIYGALEGQGANRFTARIHGETEASATIEAEARPQLTRDWSLDLNFSDGFRWSEPPVLHVLGREIPLANYAEPRIRSQLAHVRERALAAARRLDLHDKAARAWRDAFEPVELSDNPQVWLQLTPQKAAFAGVRADSRVLRGSLELSGSAETFVGQQPPAVTATALPPLGHDVSEPGTFEVILPVRIGYDVLKDKITQAVTAVAPVAGMSIQDVEVYPSSGKLVVGLRVAKATNTDANAGQWTYLTAALQVDADGHAVRLSDLAAATSDEGIAAVIDPLIAQLRDKMSVDYEIAYENLLNAANAKLTRPLKDGFRMEGQLSSAKLEKVYLPADGIVIALRASGELKILYGM